MELKEFSFVNLKHELQEMLEQIDNKQFTTQIELGKWLFGHKLYLTYDRVYMDMIKEKIKVKVPSLLAFTKKHAYTFYLYSKLENKIKKKLDILPESGS